MIPLAGGGDGQFPLSDSMLSLFPERVLQGKPYDVSALFFYNCNPLFSHGHIEGFSQAMGKIPFIVSFSPYMDETTQMADLILPDHTYLEKWQSNFTYTFQGFPVVGVGKPVVRPRYNTRDTVDVIIEIAKGLGQPVAKAFPWKDSREVLTETIKKVYAMNKGDLFAPELDEALLRELVRRGWRAPGYKNFEEFWAGIQEKGGWWDPAYSYEEWERIFRTPSKKFEFYSQTLKYQLEKRGVPASDVLNGLKASGVEAKGDQLFLPHWESKLNASPDSEKDYPFHLKIFNPLVFAGSIHANDPYRQDISSIHSKQKWNSWVEISPGAAEKLGIKEDDWVWVESPLAKLKCRAKLTLGAMPQVVNVPLGLGHRALGR